MIRLEALTMSVVAALLPTLLLAQSPAPAPPTVQMKVLLDHATEKVTPIYPAIANAAHVTGTVVVGIEIDATGKETTAVVLSGPELLRAASLDAAKQWKFRPVEVNGTPSTVRSAVEFRFAAGDTSRGSIVTPK